MVCDPEDPNCNQEARHEENNNSTNNNNDNDHITPPNDQSSPDIADQISITQSEPIVEELTNAQKIGKVLTVIYVDFFILAPIEGLLIYASILLPATGPIGIAEEVILVPIELAIADLGLSLAINTSESIESGYNVEFKWTLLPLAASVLPQPAQNFLHQLIPGIFP